MGRPATLKVEILADARGVGKGVADADSKLSGLGKSASKLGVLMKATVAGIAGAAVVKFAADTVKSASDAQQAFGAVDSIFGKHADSVKRNAKQAADAVGLSSTQYAEMASILGAQLTNMGRSQAQAASQTDQLIKLGSDLAATYGGSVADAVEAVSSLMKGETDPIERYGVSIKQSDINARLASQGLGKLTGAAAKQAQATAVLQLLTQQTTAAHGQFASQTGTLAEQQQILAAKFDNVKTRIGSALLPVISSLFSWFSSKLLPAAQRIERQLAVELGPTIDAVGGFVTRVLVPAVRSLVSWFADKLVPLIAKSVRPIIDGLGSAWRSITGAVQDNEGSIGKVVNVLRVLVEFAGKYVMPVFAKLTGVTFRALGEAIGSVLTVVSRLIDAVGWLVDKLGKVASLVGGPLSKAAGILGKLNPFGGVPLTGAVGGLVGGVGGVTAPVGRLLTATAGDPLPGAYNVTAGGVGVAPVVVDRRDLSVTIRVDGALDPVAVGRQLDQLLRAHQVRIGAAPAWGA